MLSVNANLDERQPGVKICNVCLNLTWKLLMYCLTFCEFSRWLICNVDVKLYLITYFTNCMFVLMDTCFSNVKSGAVIEKAFCNIFVRDVLNLMENYVSIDNLIIIAHIALFSLDFANKVLITVTVNVVSHRLLCPYISGYKKIALELLNILMSLFQSWKRN